jgi:hypothetical protein
MDYAQMKADKEARLEKHNEEFADQIRLQGYIESLEKDNEANERIVNSESTPGKVRRSHKRFIAINLKDINRYKKMLSKMPPVPEFK